MNYALTGIIAVVMALLLCGIDRVLGIYKRLHSGGNPLFAGLFIMALIGSAIGAFAGMFIELGPQIAGLNVVSQVAGAAIGGMCGIYLLPEIIRNL